MPSSDKNTKVKKTQAFSELYLLSGGRDWTGNISQLSVMRAMTGTYRLLEQHGEWPYAA